MKALVVVDMQNDFVDGVLGSKEAVRLLSTMPLRSSKISLERYFIR